MAKSNERMIHYFDLVLRAQAKDVKPIRPKSAKDLASYIHGAFNAGYAERQYKNGKEWVYIADMRFSEDGKQAHILVNKTDKLGADHSVYHPVNKKRRFFDKQDGEGNEHSAHIVWNLEKSPPHNNHLFLLESAVGLSSGTIVSFFNHVLREVAKKNRAAFQVPHPDGSKDRRGEPRKVNYSCKIELHGHLSKSFEEDLKAGKINEIEIYSETQRDEPFDDHGHAREHRRSVFLEEKPEHKSKGNLSLLKSVFKKSVTEDYEFARVAFRTEEDIPRTVRLHTETGRIINDALYVKKAKIDGFDAILRTSYGELYKPILDKMLKLI